MARRPGTSNHLHLGWERIHIVRAIRARTVSGTLSAIRRRGIKMICGRV